jgi:hypothetical protein
MSAGELVKQAAKSGDLGRRVAEGLKSAVGNKDVRKAATALAGTTATGAGKAGIDRAKYRGLARDHARQMGGTYSKAVVQGRRRWVVWSGTTPVAVYPEVGKDVKLTQLPELKNYCGKRITPRGGGGS